MKRAEEMIDQATEFGGKAQTKNDLVRLMQDYARLQIEQDRERVKAKYPPCGDWTVNEISASFRRAIDQTPIILT